MRFCKKASAISAVFLAILFTPGCHRQPPVTTPAQTAAVTNRYLEARSLPADFKPWFEDVAISAGINNPMGHNGKTPLTVLEVMGPGCAVCDFDGDGHADILVAGQAGPVGGGKCKLYRNNGNGTFTDVTAGSGLEAPGNYMGIAVGDIDNDGKPDIVITGYGVVKLFRNLGNCKFQDITKNSGIEAPSSTSWATSAAFADVDRDGKLDLYIARYVIFNDKTIQFCDYGMKASCGPIFYDPQIGSMYRNVGNGKFKDVTGEWGMDGARGKTLGAAFADVNGDGWPDLYLGNDEMPGDLYLNLGAASSKAKRFKSTGVESGVGMSGAGQMQGAMGVDFGDYDHDGRPDLFVTTFEFEQKSLYHNGEGALFNIVSQQTGIGPATANFVGFGTKFIDVNNDGWLDIAIANGHIHDNQTKIDKLGAYAQPLQLFINDNGRAFVNRSLEAGTGFTTPAVGRGLATGDLNDDGLVDVVVTDVEGNLRVLMNRNQDHNNWLRITLTGTHCNRMAIGARVTVKAGEETWAAECTTGGSYLSASDPRLHFGLGKHTSVDSVTVNWPDGKQSTVKNPHVPGDLAVVEP